VLLLNVRTRVCDHVIGGVLLTRWYFSEIGDGICHKRSVLRNIIWVLYPSPGAGSGEFDLSLHF